MAAAPRAWEDHASTLRQFLIVQDALGGETGWLGMLRPPRSLHYAGDAAFAADADRAGLDDALASLLEAERIGFGFGGLAAGAELAVAEALLAHGAELHVILPADPAGFAARFVDPHGAAWRARFDAALEAAESVALVRPLQAPPDPRLADLASEVARGAAMLNAERLMSEAVLLRVGVDPGPPSGLRTHLVVPPAGLAAPQGEQELADESRVALCALLAVSVGGGADAAFEDRLEDVQETLAQSEGVRIAPHLGGDSIIIGYDGPLEAAAAARAIHAALRTRMPLRVAGHYGLIPCVRDPFIRRAQADRERHRDCPCHRPRHPARYALRLARFRRHARGPRRAARAARAGSASSRPSTAARRSASTRCGPTRATLSLTGSIPRAGAGR